MQEDTSAAPQTYAVVGAGPFGLIAARALLRAGIDVEIVERHTHVGGIWDIDNPGSPMYETCHFITSKHLGGFLDYPMPDDYPLYPSWRQVRDYIRAMALDHGLLERTRFGAEVVGAVPATIGGVDAWQVSTADGETRPYRGVVYACGQQWHPFKPEVEGEEDFLGEVITSSRYRSPEQLRGKRVLVVGAGNSGVDIAVDAAQFADRACLSTRRPYHFLPKQVFGVATPDLLTGKVDLPPVPGVGGPLTPQDIAELVLATVGDLGRFGLPVPDAPLGSTQPIVSDLALHCFSHGTLQHRPDVRRFHPDAVEFDDGSVEPVDLVIFATGYDMEIPWLPEGLVEYDRGHPVFHLGSLALGVPGLYAVGALHPSRADAYALFDQLAQIVVADAVAELTGEGAEVMELIRAEYRPDLRGDFPFIDTRRNANQVDNVQLDRLLDELDERFGIEIPRFDRPGFYETVRATTIPAAR
jgi:cation diffusion facilitator CzcD-associated flavoprotein CzcO